MVITAISATIGLAGMIYFILRNWCKLSATDYKILFLILMALIDLTASVIQKATPYVIPFGNIAQISLGIGSLQLVFLLLDLFAIFSCIVHHK